MIALLLLLLLTSCSMSELVAVPETRSSDTTAYTPRHRDTTEISGVPVTFDVTVEDWK